MSLAVAVKPRIPLIVIELFLKYAINSYSEQSSSWKSTLSLLAICHEWREIALPLVYKAVYFIGASENGTGMNMGLSNRYSLNAAGKTNIGLVKHTRNSGFVKSLNFTIVYSQYLYDLVNDIDVIFEFNSNSWTNVRSISICLTPYGDNDESDRVDGDQTYKSGLEQSIIYFADRIYRAMPMVTSLHLSIEPSFNTGIVLGKQIAAAYAYQLKTLTANRSSISMGLRFSTALTSLDIVLQQSSGAGLDSMVLYADCLQDLKLRNVPDAFCWDFFVNAAVAHRSLLKFSSLQRLALYFNNTNSSQQIDMLVNQKLKHINEGGVHGSRKYEFPKLTSLFVFVRSSKVLQNTFCTTAYHWPNIRSLEIEGYGDMDMLIGHSDPLVLEQNIQVLSHCIAMQMPGISKIGMSGFIESEESSILLSTLVKQYSEQIKRFYTCYPVELEFYTTLDMLESLTINSSLRYSLDFVRACAGTLKSLELDNLAHGFSWSLFRNRDIDNSICFKRLEQANIVYNTNVVDFHSDYQYFGYRHIYGINEAAADCPRLRKIYIGNASYCSLQNILCFGFNRWESVSTLEIELANFENIENVDLHLPVFLSCLEQFGQQIVHYIPNINTLYCGGDRTSSGENILYNVLIRGYFGQLKRLWSTSPVHPAILEKKNSGLESLDISLFNSISALLAKPRICVTEMDKLQLVGLPADFSWSWFKDAGDSGDIAFNNLTSFSLDLNTAAAAAIDSTSICQMVETRYAIQNKQQNNIIVYMPKITSVVVKARDPNADLAASSLVVQNVGSINLKGPAGALPLCANSLTYSVANYLDIDITDAGTEDEEHFYQLTNSWLQSSSFINRSWLRINHLGFDLNASLVSWANLCSLDICCDIGPGTLVDLLHRLPSLDALHVDRLYAVEMIPAIRDMESVIYTCAFIRPISTSVRSLEISGFAEGCVSNVLAASVKYLLLAVPSLEKAYVPEEIAFSINSFIKQLDHTYPHLGSITFN